MIASLKIVVIAAKISSATSTISLVGRIKPVRVRFSSARVGRSSNVNVTLGLKFKATQSKDVPDRESKKYFMNEVSKIPAQPTEEFVECTKLVNFPMFCC